MGEFSKFFGLAFSALLSLVNPLGDALVFLSLVGNAPPATYRSLARKIAVSTTLFLMTIEAVGTAALRFFGISLPIVQVSGGLAIAAMGWKLLNQEDSDGKEKYPDGDGSEGLRSLEQKVFYPFTFPISVGPGCIVVMLTLSAHASVKGILPSVAAHVGICDCSPAPECRGLLLLRLRADNNSTCFSTDFPWHPSSYSIRLAVHRCADHV